MLYGIHFQQGNTQASLSERMALGNYFLFLLLKLGFDVVGYILYIHFCFTDLFQPSTENAK